VTAGAKDRSRAAIAFLLDSDESAVRVLPDMSAPTRKANARVRREDQRGGADGLGACVVHGEGDLLAGEVLAVAAGRPQPSKNQPESRAAARRHDAATTSRANAPGYRSAREP